VGDFEDSGERPGNAGPVFRPDAFARRLRDVSLANLAARGFRGIIVDLDNTLVAYGQDALAAADIAWIADARAHGFTLCLVSNNFNGRVTRVANELAVPAVPSALKPFPAAFVRALRLLGTPRAQTVVIGDQLFTDVFGAKLLGLHAILTEPLVADDWLGTRVLRALERLALGRRPPP
jgi:HAD superfamily phosphatase (TIGR01668 family)